MSDDELHKQYLAGDQAAGDRLMLRYVGGADESEWLMVCDLGDGETHGS